MAGTPRLDGSESAVVIGADNARVCERCKTLLAGITSLKPSAGPASARPNAAIIIAADRDSTLATLARMQREAPTSRLLGVFCVSAGSAPPSPDYFAHGLDDFLSCPWSEADFTLRLRRLLPALRTDHRDFGWQDQTCLIGRSERFLKFLGQVSRAARSHATVLLTGETGTGKELAARAIHYLSRRAHRAFVPLNCGAVPDHLFENELFGHHKGAFTDASTTERGLIAEAEGGTFFFDEIDTLSPTAQVKMLRLVEHREYRPLGAMRSLVADVRIIAATNADLASRVRARAFREDLYHRLRVLTLHVPSLRDRAADIPLLARHFLGKYADEAPFPDCEFERQALARLVDYDWPGNVRELESVIHRAMVLCTSKVLRAEDLDVSGDPAADAASADDPGRDEPFREAKHRAIHHFEFSYLTQLLTRHEGNISQAARATGTDRRALQRLLDKHKLNRSTFCQSV